MSLLRFLFNRDRTNRKSADNSPRMVEKGRRQPLHSFEATLSGVDLQNQDGSWRQEVIARAPNPAWKRSSSHKWVA